MGQHILNGTQRQVSKKTEKFRLPAARNVEADRDRQVWPDLDSVPPDHGANRPLRRQAVLQLQRSHGNTKVARMISETPPGNQLSLAVPGAIQRKNGKGGGKSNGKGSGKVKGAKEVFYEVSGKTLEDLRGPLKHFGDNAAETKAPITIDGTVVPEKKADGTMFIKVKWITVDMEVHLPRWKDYKQACPAAQKEWDRFMGQTRIHEQQAHVDKAEEFVKGLGEEDTVIEGSSVDDLKSKLEAKGQELKKRLQAIHDACDHGAAIDALLHPENGVCE
ncbi:MAG: DUF922 domain-containing protein [Chloroflexota bacterium]|jgi:predicted secreted Zn-dependent protease